MDSFLRLFCEFKIKSLLYKDLILNSRGCRKSNQLLRHPHRYCYNHRHPQAVVNVEFAKRKLAHCMPFLSFAYETARMQQFPKFIFCSTVAFYRKVYFKRYKWYRLKTRRVCKTQTRSLYAVSQLRLRNGTNATVSKIHILFNCCIL